MSTIENARPDPGGDPGADHMPPPRHEIKIPLPAREYADFKQALFHLGVFPEATFPDRIIHSIYLDDPGFADYLDNVSGLSRRGKTRIRWYNEDVRSLALELKIKRNRISRKYVYRLENEAAVLPHSRAALRTLFMANRHLEVVKQSLALVPTIEVEYLRHYFQVTDWLRMTIDENQMFRRLYPHKSIRSVRSPVDYVVEFKFPAEKMPLAKQLLFRLPGRVFRHSKYVIGVDTVCV